MRKLHVIIADGEKAFRDSAAAVLSKARYLATPVAGFDEAAAELKRLRGRAVVLAGLTVGGRSGISFLQETRKSFTNVPFIFADRKPDPGQVIEALREGAHDLLKKPVEGGTLRRSVGRALERLNLGLESDWQEEEIRKLLARNRSELQAVRELCDFKGSMIATIAHDFRSALTVLDGYHQLINETCKGCRGDSLELFTQARRSVARLRTMASTLLDYEALERGQLRIVPSTFDVNTLLSECVSFYRPYAAQKDVDVRLDEGTVPGIRATGDAARVMEVLENLVHNAVKFTPSGGRITIGANPGSDGLVEMWVADTGPGMPKATVRQLLGEAKGATPKDKARLGLGLKICRRLMEAQNGSISIESVPKKGTRILLTMPR